MIYCLIIKILFCQLKNKNAPIKLLEYCDLKDTRKHPKNHDGYVENDFTFGKQEMCWESM